MAVKQILPGFGERITTESVTAANATSADQYDMSRCAQFAVQIKAVTGSPTLQPEQTFDGSHWVSLGSAITAVAGTIARYPATSGPYGVIRFKVTGSNTAGTFVLVGFELPMKS